LIPAGNEKRFGMENDTGHLRLLRGCAIRDNECGDRIQFAEPVYIGVVVIASSSVQNEKIPAVAREQGPISVKP
jgi:hypothetical protein